MSRREALERARCLDLDLVEVNFVNLISNLRKKVVNNMSAWMTTGFKLLVFGLL